MSMNKVVSPKITEGHTNREYARMALAASPEADGTASGFVKSLVRSSLIFLAVNSPRHIMSPCYREMKMKGRSHSLGLRSVMTTPHRSSTSFSFLRSKSRSVVPLAVPVVTRASFTPS